MTLLPFVALVNGRPVVVESVHKVRDLTAEEAAAVARAAAAVLTRRS